MIYFLLIAIWPLINYISTNYAGLSGYNEILILLTVLISGALFAYFIAKYILKLSIDKLILPLFLTTFLFFSYSDIVEKVISPYNPFPNVKASYLYLAAFIITTYLAWKISSKISIQKASKVLVFTVFALSIVNLINKNFLHTTAKITTDNIPTLSFQFKHKPNVYYILVDAYARQDTLKEVLDYNNELFLKKLSKRNFIISRSARSNYHFTIASLSATMDMRYHIEDENSLISNEFMRKSLKGINQVRKIFRQNGYYIINIPAHWHQVSCHGNEDACIMKHNFEVYKFFLMPTPLKLIKFPVYYTDLEAAKAITYNTAYKKPKFSFIHIDQIHDRVVYEGAKNYDPTTFKVSKTTYKQSFMHYTTSLNSMNSKILDFVDYIMANDPNSIIIIQADHGPALTAYINNTQTYIGKDIQLQNKQDFRYRFGIFSAIHIPNYNEARYKEIKKYFSGTYSLVNTFRYIFAYLSDKKPVLLPERSYFLYEDESAPIYRQIDIQHLTN